jgi:uncharacterized protein YbaP (TraB family)
MKVIATLLLFALSVLNANSQPVKKTEKKYQGLLWEITGNGLSRPSYLFGTMHVSNKLAFHLADSFFTAIKNVDMVALETNPANWQDDYSKLNNSGNNKGTGGYDEDYAYRLINFPNDYMHKNTFAIDRYESNLKLALATEPAMINGMLYRTYNYGADFEEDTYLDMYIFQTGKKLGKKLGGVENFEESEKLVAEAYKDAARERRNAKKVYDDEDDDSYEDRMKNPFSLEDAYRRGDLDMLDSMEKKQFRSKAFLEKFLYKRNEIQANSIDSIIKSKTSLFAGVGSAHLPGKRGVIEILRSKGYKLRAVKMGLRDGLQKETIDKIRVPVTFKQITADDEIFSVEIPGEKFYSFSKFEDLNTKQYADMGNGAYYVVSRVKTNGLLLGDDEEDVFKKTDSLLYENIPGKMLKKTTITKNGYKGFDITNRTRRGDVQHYNIFITPFEVLVFKISGISDYVLEGGEATRFLNSVNFKTTTNESWLLYSPPTGGFAVKMPHLPLLQKDFMSNRLEYTAYDKTDKTTYALFKTSIHNYGFIEEDSFDLNLMEESYASSEIIDKQLSRHWGKWQGYPVLDCKYKHKDGTGSTVRYLLQGANYYAQLAHYKTESKNVKLFFDSFRLMPFVYPDVKLRTDTAMRITVKSPTYPEEKKGEDLMETIQNMMDGYNEEEEESQIPKFTVKNAGNDTIGEKIFFAYIKMPKNISAKDSADIFNDNQFSFRDGKSQSYIYLKKDSGITASGFRYKLQQVTDTGSSRTIIAKSFYKGSNLFALITQTDTLTPRSSLLANFIETFMPADTLSSESPFVKRNKIFFEKFASKDSATHARALKQLDQTTFDSSDLPQLKKIIDTLTWKTKDYLQLKQDFISKLDDIKDSTLPVYMRKLYINAKDTADLQNTILQTLLRMRTKKSFEAFKDLIIMEPPVVVNDNDNNNSYRYTDMVANIARSFSKTKKRYSGYSGNWYPLLDTLQLAKTVMPDILQLINLDDYKGNTMELLTLMVDSGYAGMKDYEPFFTKFYAEAKQELKKEKAAENQKSIAKAEKENKADDDDYGRSNNDKDNGNEMLKSYAVLLMPYWDKNPGVPVFFDDMLKLKNKQIKFDIMLVMLRNKLPVPDSLLTSYAADDEYRIDLYRRLKKVKMLDKFPAKYNNQADLVKSALFNNTSSYNRYDTLVLLEKLPAAYKNKKGVVYFYKYKNKKEEKKWKVISFGLQPENAKEFDDDNEDFVAYSGYSYSREDDNKLDEEKPVKEQLQQMLKKLLYKMHESAARFYDRTYDDYKELITEKVKSNRFGD